MRKLIVRHFALDCWVQIGNRTFNFTRASRVIFPLFILSGLASIYESYQLIAYSLTALSLFFGFAYFPIFGGVKYDELNDVQKFQYQLKKPLTEAQKIDFKLVLIRLKLKYKNVE